MGHYEKYDRQRDCIGTIKEKCRNIHTSTKEENQGTSQYKQSEYHVAMRGESWKLSLQLTIDNAMRYATNKHTFFELMEIEDYMELIDSVYGTGYRPSGYLRQVYAEKKGMNEESVPA